MKTSLQRLTEWYSQQCNGDWEHSYGFIIDTLDNPGVPVSVDLRETDLETVPFEERKEDYESTDRWMICQRTADKFQGRGAPCKMEDIIEEFLRWSELHRREPIQPPQRNAGSRPSSGVHLHPKVHPRSARVADLTFAEKPNESRPQR